MIQKVFAVRDTKAVAFLQPFFSNSAGAAMRAFGDAVGDGKSPLALHPSDYILYELGSFDDGTGAFESLEVIKLLCNGADFVEVKTSKDLINNVKVLEGVGNGK